MGYSTAVGLSKAAVSDVTLQNVILVHLTCNCYPPFPQSFGAPAFRAVKACRAGNWDKRIRMPKGVKHNKHGNLVPAGVLIESLRMDGFVTEEVDE